MFPPKSFFFDQVQAAGAAQTPQRWLYGAEGRILLARSPLGLRSSPRRCPNRCGPGWTALSRASASAS
jgi:hypothetical protein